MEEEIIENKKEKKNEGSKKKRTIKVITLIIIFVVIIALIVVGIVVAYNINSNKKDIRISKEDKKIYEQAEKEADAIIEKYSYVYYICYNTNLYYKFDRHTYNLNNEDNNDDDKEKSYTEIKYLRFI